MEIADQALVARCLGGERDAFAGIVERYQSLICSIAYSATGSLAASEELAQETFVAAWRSLGELREPERLRPWLCGIARNLVRNSARKRRHDVLQKAAPLDAALAPAVSDADPAEATIASEEAALLDRTLDSMPETYREPLVLYYREEESVERVAELLDLSIDAVKQRLARGRKLLRTEIAAVVERGLRQSAPGRAFTIGVIAALPAMTGTAKAAVMTATGAKGVTAMNAAGWTGIIGAVLGPIIGIAGGWFGVKMSLKSARSERERAFILKSTWWMVGIVLLFTIGLTTLLIVGRELAGRSPTAFAAAVIGLVVAYSVALVGSIVVWNRRIAQIREQDGTATAAAAARATQNLPHALQRWQGPAVYESSIRLLGLPLVSIRFNGVVGSWRELRPAKGWIAIGDWAYGVVFACGSVAVGGIACGAMSLGILSLAGLGVGVFAFAGVSAGWFSLGGLAFGMLATGGCAVAWQAAYGGLAVAKSFAVGGLAVAPNANNEAAKQLITTDPFFQASNWLMTHGWIWFVFVGLMLLPMFWARAKAERAMRGGH